MYAWVLDETGSDANVVYNNTVNAGHYHGIAISEDATYKNINNVVKYNKVTAAIEYPIVDFSSYDNCIKDNIVQ